MTTTERTRTLTLTDINFECEACGQHLVVDAAAAGSLFPCPLCARNLTVPSTSVSRNHFAAEFHARMQEPWHEELQLLRHERDRSEAAHSQAAAEIRQLYSEKAALEAEIQRQQAAAHSEALLWQAEVDRVERERMEALQAAADTAAQANEMLGERAAWQEALELNRQRASALESQLQAREIELAEKVTYLNSVREELAELEIGVVYVRAEADSLRPLVGLQKELAGQLEAARERLAETERVAAERESALEELTSENQTLRHGLNESESGRELVAMREKARRADEGRATAERLRRLAEEEATRFGASTSRLGDECEALRRRCQEAERRAEEGSQGKIDDDRAVLRSIVERQQSEIVQRHGELRRLRRAQLALRLAYALVCLSTLGLVGLGLAFAQRFWGIFGSF